jgi:hypothetical protein
MTKVRETLDALDPSLSLRKTAAVLTEAGVPISHETVRQRRAGGAGKKRRRDMTREQWRNQLLRWALDRDTLAGELASTAPGCARTLRLLAQTYRFLAAREALAEAVAQVSALPINDKPRRGRPPSDWLRLILRDA